MIIKGNKESNKRTGQLYWLIPIVLLTTVFVLLQRQDPISSGPKQELVAYCSAEIVQDEYFVEDKLSFLNASTQSKTFAKQGQYSSAVDDQQMEGMSFVFQNPEPGKTYLAQVYRRTNDELNSHLAVRSSDGTFMKQTHVAKQFDANYWGVLQLYFTIPRDADAMDYEVYVYKSKGEEVAYFDELTLQEVDPTSVYDYNSFEVSTLQAQIDPNGLDQLEQVKERATKDGIYIKQEDDFVKAKIIDDGVSKKANMRFKGDWLDHLSWKGESYRIEMNKEESWKGLQLFSVQLPKTRGFLNEWVYHEFLKYEDVLTPRYDFILFKLNDKDAKVYAFEEHFTKNLVESQLRREGPILKFDESHFWEGMKRSLDADRTLAEMENKNKAFWSAEILPFKPSKVAKDTVLSTHFDQAQSLMHAFKQNSKPANQLFDVERMAKFVAISDITMAHHALTWHNLRFYYNPITNLLEPIGFDGFGDSNPMEYAFTLYSDIAYQPEHIEVEPVNELFKDEDFIRAYFGHVTRMSEPTYVAELLSQLDEGIMEREAFIGTAEPGYTYNRNLILEKAKKIQKDVYPFDNSLQVYTQRPTRDSLQVRLINTHTVPLEITIPGMEADPFILLPSSLDPKGGLDMIISKDMRTINFSLPGVPNPKTAQVSPFSTPSSTSARQQLSQDQTNQTVLEQHGELVRFKEKQVLITEPLLIKGINRLWVEAGTTIQFKGDGFIVSEAPITFNGTVDNPILVESLDQLNGSITVLQANGRSIINHTVFKDLNTQRYRGWNLTGAVTFFESDVDIAYASFISNHCEDGLNIVKSNFTVSNCIFEDIKSDAFDADYCVGTLSQSTFNRTGNDAIDFSTSQITVTDCTMTQIGDKAISAGEQATITANNIQIDGANFAVASKDKSVLRLNNIELKNCETGFAAYQKKPEFGSATIVCTDYEAVDVEKLFMIEEGSSFIQNE